LHCCFSNVCGLELTPELPLFMLFSAGASGDLILVIYALPLPNGQFTAMVSAVLKDLPSKYYRSGCCQAHMLRLLCGTSI
jgi:hypothetical protein